MKRTVLTAVFFSTVGLTQAFALDTDAVVGGALGGAAGAVVGSALGGREGAVIGAGLGGATGAAIATKDQPRRVRREVIYVEPHDRGLHLGHRKHRHKHHHHWDD
ncbi:hypothetical protein JCM16106_16890 [Hydrogenophilus islandicus]